MLDVREGSMKLDDKGYAPRDINDALRAGVGIVPANRIRDGLAGELTAAENLLMKPRGAWWRPLSRRKDTAESTRLLTRYSVQPPLPDREVATFSGGNQQKILLAKWLGHGRRLIVLNEPSAGVDVGAKADIHQQIRSDCDATASSALVISTDFQEIADLCDRALVMRRGAVVGELAGNALKADLLTEMAYGGTL